MSGAGLRNFAKHLALLLRAYSAGGAGYFLPLSSYWWGRVFSCSCLAVGGAGYFLPLSIRHQIGTPNRHEVAPCRPAQSNCVHIALP